MLVQIALTTAIAAASPGMPAPLPARRQITVDAEAGVPVFPDATTDRPYVVLGEVKAGVRKATIVNAASSRAKIYRELWERAKRMGADAVINAAYGRSHISAFSWGQTNATGTAIKFTGPATRPLSPP